jgi:hypothetical protein
MDFFNTQVYQTIASNHLIQIVFSIGTILGGFKFFLIANGWKIISFVRAYRNKNKFMNHDIFHKIHEILNNRTIENSIIDIAKKEIAKDIIEIEVKIVKKILKMNLKFIFKGSLMDYIKSYSTFSSGNLVNLFRNEYLESRSLFLQMARQRLTKNGYMSQEHFNSFMIVYLEFSAVYEIMIIENLEALSKKKNIYSTLWVIMDCFEVLLEVIYKTISHKINLMNGRVHGINYKGYLIGKNYKYFQE